MNTSTLQQARKLIALLASEDPNLTAAELLERIDELVEGVDAATERSTCRNCGKPIEQRPNEDGWVHCNPARNRGCRAASFDYEAEEAWDSSLARHWKARPMA
ncbi:hypothetical protein KV205_00120 [Streptomyces sp. SKN60]|uniref:hypothetical protein n=1 Tax=Streptomyces sp. SKN60 TaxID=2855506 RepID=UPI002246B399|nr:hypothetical protein [Streptomyces sp. SKN60]MCX2178952.1 hypothetical protein [Streptomyces sp. SKN60]